ncbi:MAG TPA: molybdopterin-synthase adenylyltransferase MoeB [Gemmatimonadales bacterium]|nr:molybdopterin-synthase adenylyltransferase MoeB [Gemmatimonadales bacterium]
MLSHDELIRYSRHLILPEIGLAGQERLKAAHVLLIGAGGLGSPAALYLAAAGVGTIGLIDFDVVDRSNLQRQVVHGTAAVGTSKLASARARLADLNPHVQLETIEARLTAANALEHLRGWDVVLDGSDNFPTRYLVNDACVLLGLPTVYGAVLRFEGQVSVFDARRGPCYRCLYRDPPPPELVPSCAEGGVLGVVPGIIGSLQALEAVKLVTGIGTPLIGRLVLFDGMKLQFREISLLKDPDCVMCGPHPTVTQLIDYEAFCGVGAPPAANGEISATDADAVRGRDRSVVLLDVREPFEWDIVHVDGARHVPLRELPARLRELDGHAEVLVYCHHGTRSRQAMELLRAAGFSKVRSVRGGIDAWAAEVDPRLARY